MTGPRVRIYCCHSCETHGTVCEVATEEDAVPTRCPMNAIPSWGCEDKDKDKDKDESE